jgi:hypothetical protein
VLHIFPTSPKNTFIKALCKDWRALRTNEVKCWNFTGGPDVSVAGADMEVTATASITKIGDEYFLADDEALLKALECSYGQTVEFTVRGNRLIVTRQCAG